MKVCALVMSAALSVCYVNERRRQTSRALLIIRAGCDCCIAHAGRVSCAYMNLRRPASRLCDLIV